MLTSERTEPVKAESRDEEGHATGSITASPALPPTADH